MATTYEKIATGLRDALRGRGIAHSFYPGPGGSDMASISTLKRTAQVGTVQWFNDCVERGRQGIFTERVVIEPGLAAEMLRHNPDNRHISPTKAEHYARDMAAGRWTENGETIIISNSGELNDGQHRLQAVIDSNQPIPFLLVFGVPRESRTTVDQGRGRSAGDYLCMDGVLYGKNSATAAKFIMGFERSGGKNIAGRSTVTNAEIVARVKADDCITQSAAWAAHHYPSFRHLVSNTVMMACHYILSEIHSKDADEYLTQVALGENIKRGDPAFAVRQAFLADKRERQEAMEIIFHGWNAFREGRVLKVAKCFGTFPALI